MLRRRRDELPTTFPSSSSQGMPDGSGKSVKMDAPLVKAIRGASHVTKYTYIWFAVSVLFIWCGWSWISSASASMSLDCRHEQCTLTINKPKSFTPRNDNLPPSSSSSSKRKVRIEFTRDQLVRSDNILYDPNSQRILENYGLSSPTYDAQRAEEEEDEINYKGANKQHRKKYKKKKNKKKKYTSKMWGPDENGNYQSYTLVLRDATPQMDEPDGDGDNNNESPSMKMARQMQEHHNKMMNDPNSLASQLSQFAYHDADMPAQSDSSLEYNLHLRDFNVGQTRRLARTAVSKINAYAKGRRSSFTIREARPVSWQGLTLLIIGIFSLILCLLLGQFWEEYDATKDGSYKKRMAEVRRRKEMDEKRRRDNRKRGGTRPMARSGYQGRSVGAMGRSSGMDISKASSGGGTSYGAAKRSL